MSAVILQHTAAAHHGLRDDIRAYAAQNNCVFQDAGIEHKTAPDALRILSGIFDPTALYLRGAPDAWIASRQTKEHPEGIAIQLEFKSRMGEWDNMALEAQPLASAMGRSRPPLNIRVLYCYRDPAIGVDVAFWASNPPPFSRLLIGSKDESIRKYIERAFPRVPPEEKPDMKGSGDSCVIVHKDDWIDLPHWRALLNTEIFGF